MEGAGEEEFQLVEGHPVELIPAAAEYLHDLLPHRLLLQLQDMAQSVNRNLLLIPSLLLPILRVLLV